MHSVNVSSLGDTANCQQTSTLPNKPHPEEDALFCAAVTKDGCAHGLAPSFETHRLSDAPQDEADGWICAATWLVGLRQSLAISSVSLTSSSSPVGDEADLDRVDLRLRLGAVL